MLIDGKIVPRRSRKEAERYFRARVTALGGTVIGEYVKTQIPVHVRCPKGHDAYPQPGSVLAGRGICQKCKGAKAVEKTEVMFRARVAELGGTVISEYSDSKTRVHVRCAYGHNSYPFPNGVIWQDKGLCTTCGHEMRSSRTEIAFRDRVNDLGGVVIGEYINCDTPIHVKCAVGHDGYPEPNSVLHGRGLCLKCKGKVWDVFYVVSSSKAIKLGITSGDPSPRLRNHASIGFTDVLFLRTNLPDGLARFTETTILRELAERDFNPFRGNEWFYYETRDLVLALTGKYLSNANRKEMRS
jgi:hypothetical protein